MEQSGSSFCDFEFSGDGRGTCSLEAIGGSDDLTLETKIDT